MPQTSLSSIEGWRISINTHIKVMIELFDSLSVAGETVSEENRVLYLLANLPEPYNIF